jgi:hypothetical protein
MARFSVFRAQEVAVIGGRRWVGAGKTLADSAGVALSGDVVSAGMIPNTGLIALDASAVTAFAALGITTVVGAAMISAVGGPTEA